MKLILVTILLVTLPSLCFPATKGDMDGDNQIDVADALKILRIAVGLDNPEYIDVVQPPPNVPAAPLFTDSSGTLQVMLIQPFEIFRDNSAITYGLWIYIKNTGPTRKNMRMLITARDVAGHTIWPWATLPGTPVQYDVAVNSGQLSPGGISSFSLPIVTFDSITSWNVDSIEVF